MLPKEHQRKGYGEVWSRFARHFEIAKYTQLPPGKDERGRGVFDRAGT